MKFLALALIVLSAIPALAINCPKPKLTCKLEQLNDKGGYVTTKTASTNFIGVNRDEPSMPDNECLASLTMDIKGGSVNATVLEDMDAYLFVSEGQGARDPQFMVSAVLGKPFSISFKQQHVSCVLN